MIPAGPRPILDVDVPGIRRSRPWTKLALAISELAIAVKRQMVQLTGNVPEEARHTRAKRLWLGPSEIRELLGGPPRFRPGGQREGNALEPSA